MHLYLLGYRGSGKSTIGKLIGARLGLPVIDADDEIEQQAGASISELFAREGEAGFRDREQQIIAQIAERASSHPTVVSLGGGAILRDINRQTICHSGHRVWLTASPQTLAARIEADRSTALRRPALSKLSGVAEVVKILEQRIPLYAAVAELEVDTEDASIEQIVEKIVSWWKAQSN